MFDIGENKEIRPTAEFIRWRRRNRLHCLLFWLAISLLLLGVTQL